jgi:hypothetical protein
MAQAQGGQGPNGQESVKAAVPKDALWWTGLSGEAKNTFLEGYTAAMSRVSNRLFTECADKMKKFQSKIMSDPRAASSLPEGEVMQSWNLCVLGGSFDFGFEQRDLRNGVDEFYKEAQNSHVPIDVALQHVRDVLESKRPKGQGMGGPQGETHQ